MKKLLLLMLLLGSFSFYGQCKKFKNGVFKIEAKDGIPGTTLVRKGNRQIETVDGSKDEAVFIVKWLDECTYTLAPTPETLNKYPGFPQNGILTVKITGIKENSYTQSSSSNFADLVYTSEVIKIK